MLEQYHVILASNSPRRKELLAGLEIDFEVKTIKGLEEHFPNNLREGEIPLYLAKQKMRAYSHLIQSNELIITADTIVWKDNDLMGKPKTKENAIQMLRSLSGDTHQVYTGVCVKTKEKEVSFVAQSDVRFATLTDEEITHYIERYKPFDKAGSYGVQEWIGYIGVEHINGSFYNIMGLPIQKLYSVLREF